MLLAPAAALAAAASPVCKYVDADGRATYSNSEIKGLKKMECLEAPPPPPAAPPAPARQPGASDRPAQVPQKDDFLTQRRREERRKILEDELAQEEKLLEDARKALTEGEGVRMGGERNYQRYLDRVQAQKDAVAKHESNVNQLRQELNSLR
ncbi:MAG TPA: DUF4124 domain-containing protein [Burkholderiales bacterium]|nr:DUF4124 domain-containing protein [Burkholderiales bacterium]